VQGERYHLPMKEWPASEQPREKLTQIGAEHLATAELLAILLRVGVKGQDVLSLSNELLVTFGGLVGLSRAPLSALAQVKGIGTAKAVSIQAALELGRRLLLADAGELVQIRSPQDVASMLQLQMGLLEQEHLRVVLLNTKNRVVAIKDVYQHGLDRTNSASSNGTLPVRRQSLPFASTRTRIASSARRLSPSLNVSRFVATRAQ
jgi:DNA repair protein RadC